MTLEQLENEIAQLPADKRVLLAERILASAPVDGALEQAWYAEAERRALAGLGEAGPIYDGASVIAEAEALINERL